MTEEHDEPEKSGARRYFSNDIISLLPAAYAWQLYGWKVAIVAYILAMIPLAAMSWGVVLDKLSARLAATLRVVFILVFMVAIGISAMKYCDIDNNCHSVFWSS